jgi:FMN phosphatase YigB (HAD superfamily)
MLDPCLERLGLAPLFEGVFSCDDFATTKANPEIYDRLCERIGSQKEDLVFFDDNLGACKTAVSAGVRAVGVYDPSGEKFTEELKALCAGFVYTLDEALMLSL